MPAAIILAAGASTRLGTPKQLAHLAGEPLLVRTLRIAHAAGLAPILIVLGANANEIQSGCRLEGTQIVLNQKWREGMGSSIRAGIAALEQSRPRPDSGVLLLTCDQPAVDADHLRRLARLGEELKSPIASAYPGDGTKRTGVPAYFPDTHFSQLVQLQGDAGARSLLASAKTVPLTLGELDIDTPETLAQARAHFERFPRF